MGPRKNPAEMADEAVSQSIPVNEINVTMINSFSFLGTWMREKIICNWIQGVQFVSQRKIINEQQIQKKNWHCFSFKSFQAFQCARWHSDAYEKCRKQIATTEYAKKKNQLPQNKKFTVIFCVDNWHKICALAAWSSSTHTLSAYWLQKTERNT